MKSLNEYAIIYKQLLEKGDIQKAYTGLLKYMMSLKAHFQKSLSDKFSFGNISPGYMDYTYFPFFDKFLRDNKLRFGIVLNHEKMRFELWLMGQNAEVQKKYWELLKTTEWNAHQAAMPKYSVLEAVLVERPDFDQPDTLAQKIAKKAANLTQEVTDYIKNSKHDEN